MLSYLKILGRSFVNSDIHTFALSVLGKTLFENLTEEKPVVVHLVICVNKDEREKFDAKARGWNMLGSYVQYRRYECIL